MAGTPRDNLCCTTPGALVFCLAVFLVLLGTGFLILQGWSGAESYRGTVLFAAMGLACLANFARHRTFHCIITGPFFLLVAVALALRAAGAWKLDASVLWPIVLLVVGLALLLERRLAR